MYPKPRRPLRSGARSRDDAVVAPPRRSCPTTYRDGRMATAIAGGLLPAVALVGMLVVSPVMAASHDRHEQISAPSSAESPTVDWSRVAGLTFAGGGDSYSSSSAPTASPASGPSSAPTPQPGPVVPATVAKLGAGGRSILDTDRLAWPTATRAVTCHFGPRNNYYTGAPEYHTGTDFAIGMGADVLAAADGVVESSGAAGDYGNRIVLRHDRADGTILRTTYSHLSTIEVAIGDTVRTGQRIAGMGSTGYSTGPHLHFEVIVDGWFTDPMQWLDGSTAHFRDIKVGSIMPWAPVTSPSSTPTPTPTPTPEAAPAAPASPNPEAEPSAPMPPPVANPAPPQVEPSLPAGGQASAAPTLPPSTPTDTPPVPVVTTPTPTLPPSTPTPAPEPEATTSVPSPTTDPASNREPGVATPSPTPIPTTTTGATAQAAAGA